MFSIANNQKLSNYNPACLGLSIHPVSCLALQYLSHLMKAALHDAIKEQGSFQKWFKHEGGKAFVFSGLIQGNQGKPFTTDLQICRFILHYNYCNKLTTANNF